MNVFTCNHCHMTFEAEPPQEGPLRCPHCNGTVSAPEAESELPAGFTLGGFEVIRILGKGGMGNVYLATQVSMQRHVALKVLPKSITKDTGAVVKFLNEVKNSGRLQHPHIVTAIDAGEDNGTYFLAMQYVEGETLESLIDKRKRIPEGEALDIALMVAEALKYSWERHGIFHKDIKPGNIMIDSSSGDAYLLDMGISQRIGDKDDGDGHVEGSPFYMSPEQTKGEKLDWTTDLYSLGATLYNAVAGVPPYDDKNLMRIVEMHSTEPFPEPEERNPEAKVSQPVVKLLKKMMEKNPADRFKSWAAFIKEAEKVMKELGKKPRPRMVLSKKGKGGKIAFQKKGGFPFLLLINLVLIIAVGAAVTYYIVTSRNKSEARKSLEAAEQYIMKPGFKFEDALEAFAAAKEASERYGVEPAVKSRASEGYANVKAAAEKRAMAVAAFDKEFKRVSDLYNQAKELYSQGRSAVLEEKDDGGSLAKAAAIAKDTLKSISVIPTDDQRARQQLDQLTQAVALLSKQIDAEIRRKAQSESQKAIKRNEELSAKRAEDDQRRQKDYMVSDYKREVGKRSDELRLLFVLSARKREFETARKAFSSVNESSTRNAENPDIKPMAAAFDSWASSMAGHIDRAQRAWGYVFNSGKRLAGRSFDYGGKSVTVSSVEGETIGFNDDAEHVTISELSSSEFAPLMEKAASSNGSNAELFSFFMADGEFAQAAKIAPDESSKQELSKVAKVYLKARLLKAMKDRDSGRGSGSLDKLKKEYGSLPEYQELEKELRP